MFVAHYCRLVQLSAPSSNVLTRNLLSRLQLTVTRPAVSFYVQLFEALNRRLSELTQLRCCCATIIWQTAKPEFKLANWLRFPCDILRHARFVLHCQCLNCSPLPLISVPWRTNRQWNFILRRKSQPPQRCHSFHLRQDCCLHRQQKHYRHRRGLSRLRLHGWKAHS